MPYYISNKYWILYLRSSFQHSDSSTKLGLNSTTIRNQQNYNLLLAHINRLIRSHHKTKPPTFFFLGYISRTPHAKVYHIIQDRAQPNELHDCTTLQLCFLSTQPGFHAPHLSYGNSLSSSFTLNGSG